MSGLATSLSRILRRHRPLLAVLVFAVILLWVPIMPYSPSCWERPSVGPVFLAPAFRKEFTERLQQWDVNYIAVDGLVFVRFWDWFADPDDWLINASNKSVSSLVDPAWGADVSTIPPRVRDLITRTERDRGEIWPTCKLVRAVAIEGW